MPNSVVGPGQVIAGRYRLESWLGQGGMGSVYRAHQLSVQRTVALKRLVDEHLENASHIERFEREALALSRLRHQSTVRLFDFGRDERGCPFLVMEYLEGSDLATDLERHGPMRWDQALAVALQVLGSLGEAHAHGIVHRDIKPANLFLCAAGDWPVLKVLDFGIARGAEPLAGLTELTLTGTVLGSAPYMSPEQAQGLRAGPAADLYSLGIVLFELLTGQTPFEARTLTAQLIAKMLEVAPSLRDVCPDLQVPRDVEALVASLLERDPRQRLASAEATARRIVDLLATAALQPLARATQRPKAVSSQASTTEPMPLPRTIDEGWTPRQSFAPSPPARRAWSWVSVLAVAGAGAALWSWRGPLAAPQPEAALAVPPAAQAAQRPIEASASSPDAEEDGHDVAAAIPAAGRPLTTRVEPASAALRATLAVAPASPARSPRATGRRPGWQPRARAPAPTTAATPTIEATTPITPETLLTPLAAPALEVPAPERTPPEPEPTPSEPAATPPEPEPAATPPAASLDQRPASALGTPIIDAGYWTIGTARAAAGRGDITPAQRNEIIAALRQRRLEARARAARAFREGRIGYEELLDRQRAIDRRFDGW